jgi:hypothetical protein
MGYIPLTHKRKVTTFFAATFAAAFFFSFMQEWLKSNKYRPADITFYVLSNVSLNMSSFVAVINL